MWCTQIFVGVWPGGFCVTSLPVGTERALRMCDALTETVQDLAAGGAFSATLYDGGQRMVGIQVFPRMASWDC